MRKNGYLDPNVQKAFHPTVPGVSEHRAKLSAVIEMARKSKGSLTVAWLDVASARGSIRRLPIRFSLARYRAPPEISRLLRSWYSGLSATISTEGWLTPPMPLNIGVYRGDPPSFVVFLTAVGTLSDTLRTGGVCSRYAELYKPSPLCRRCLCC